MARIENTEEAREHERVEHELVVDDSRRAESPAGDSATPDNELPPDPDELFADESMPESGVGHEVPDEGTQTEGLDPLAGEVGDMTYSEVDDVAGTDPSDFLGDFDEALAAGSTGGLDGRNDAADYGGSGGGSGEPGTGVDAMGGLTTGLDGSNAAVPTETQNKLHDLRDQAFEAARTGKEGDLDDAVRDTAIIHDASYGGGASEVTGGSAATPYGLNEDGELVQTEGMKQVAEDNEGGFLEKLSNWMTGTSENTERGAALKQTTDEIDANGAPVSPPGNDYTPVDGEDLPDHYRDPSEGAGDQDEANAWMLGTGGGYTDPTDDSGTDANAGSVTAFDPDVYVGDPGGPIASGPEVTGAEFDDFDPNAPVYDEFDG